MLQLDTRSNRFIATIGTGVALLLALNMGILVNSHFLMPPYDASQVITYFLTFSGAIAFTVYKTVNTLTEPNQKYVEGLVIGVFGSVAVLLYLPSFIFEPMATMFPSPFPFFAVSYLLAVGVTSILVTGVVKGSELYCASETEMKVEAEKDESSKESKTDESESDGTEELQTTKISEENQDDSDDDSE